MTNRNSTYEEKRFVALSGELLGQRRRELGLSAGQVAALCNLSQDQIYRMERGQRPFTAAVHLYRLAQVLEKPMEFFFIKTDEATHPWRNRRNRLGTNTRGQR